jgi:hypothetical protein
MSDRGRLRMRRVRVVVVASQVRCKSADAVFLSLG